MTNSTLRTPEPTVRLRNSFEDPMREAIAAARTCYSQEPVSASEVTEEQKWRVAETTYEGGHHSVYQHLYFEFELQDVSTVLTHDALHTHPFYNTSQQSQRYVSIDEPTATVPPLEGGKKRRMRALLHDSHDAYRELTDLLKTQILEERGLSDTAGSTKEHLERSAEKKAMEAARYLLGMGINTTLIYTVDGVTLWRLYRLRDLSWEARRVVGEMVSRVKERDPDFLRLVEEEEKERPLPRRSTLENSIRQKAAERDVDEARDRFDERLGDRRSRLIDWTEDAESIVARSLETAVGLPFETMDDEEAVETLLDASNNPYLLESLNLSMTSPAMRALNNVHYTFMAKMSHVANAQNQRHRTVLQVKPLTDQLYSPDPDYVLPRLIERGDTARRMAVEWIEEAWKRVGELVEDGAPEEYAVYGLPRAASIRVIQSGSLMNLFYKYYNRSCLRAQAEIWLVSMEEIEQISQVHPAIGRHLGPPCYVRKASQGDVPEDWGKVNLCNQGKLYCGQPVWNFYPDVDEENILRVL